MPKAYSLDLRERAAGFVDHALFVTRHDWRLVAHAVLARIKDGSESQNMSVGQPTGICLGLDGD